MRPTTSESDVLRHASTCFVAARTPDGPHVTPVTFVASHGDVWISTSRSSAKVRAWRRDPVVAGVASAGTASIAFAGCARLYDALDPASWRSALLDAPAVAAATLRFGRKNARYFAGYAFDARRVPFAWTPPGRVLVRIRIERAAVVDANGVHDAVGTWARSTPRGTTTFRRRGRGPDPLAALPDEIARRIGRAGADAVLAMDGPGGLTAVPAGWAATAHELYAAMPSDVAWLGMGVRGPVGLAIDRASAWRAREMTGVLVQGDARSWAVGSLQNGAAAATKLVRTAGGDASDAVLVGIRPRRIVWWSGWSSGSARTGATT
jgi:Pyridoxamine 5'-phosphate oxidase